MPLLPPSGKACHSECSRVSRSAHRRLCSPRQSKRVAHPIGSKECEHTCSATESGCRGELLSDPDELSASTVSVKPRQPTLLDSACTPVYKDWWIWSVPVFWSCQGVDALGRCCFRVDGILLRECPRWLGSPPSLTRQALPTCEKKWTWYVNMLPSTDTSSWDTAYSLLLARSVWSACLCSCRTMGSGWLHSHEHGQ